MDKIVFALCAATAVLCAGLLLRGYLRSGARGLLWACLCFVGLSLNNLLLIVDRYVFTSVDMSLWRLSIALVSTLLLVCGLLLDPAR
jgi:hypothetical protein